MLVVEREPSDINFTANFENTRWDPGHCPIAVTEHIYGKGRVERRINTEIIALFSRHV